MIPRLTACVLLVILIAPRAFAAEAPRQFSASLQEGGHKVAAALGQHGGWVISSQERWDQLLTNLLSLGVATEDKLGKVDFATENLACVFHYGDEGDQFLLKHVDAQKEIPGSGRGPRVDAQFAMSYIIYKQRRAMTLGVWKMLAVPVMKGAETRVSVSTFHPMNGGPNPTIDKAQLDWEWTFNKDSGEAIGFLTAAIAPKAPAIKPGEDVLVKFTLSFASATKEKFGQFTRGTPDAIYVWDGKYSNGYRNHGFEVITPEGKTLTLRPKVIDQWDKNAPHPIAIKPGQPYTLPNWFEGQTQKSLKELGLDTTTPGTYTITGIYSEAGLPNGDNHGEMWGGIVRSNTISIEVK